MLLGDLSRCDGLRRRGQRRCGVWPWPDPGVHAGDVLARCADGLWPWRSLWCSADAAPAPALAAHCRRACLAVASGGVALLISPQSASENDLRPEGPRRHHRTSTCGSATTTSNSTSRAHNPITGVGPGNFVYRFYQFAPQVSQEPAVSVERADDQRRGSLPGDPGRTRHARVWRCFSGYLALSWTALPAAFPADAGGRISCRALSPPASSRPASAPSSSPSSTTRLSGSCPLSRARAWPAAGRGPPTSEYHWRSSRRASTARFRGPTGEARGFVSGSITRPLAAADRAGRRRDSDGTRSRHRGREPRPARLQVFARQMGILGERRQRIPVVDSNRSGAALSGRHPAPGGVVLTFDDAWADNHAHALGPLSGLRLPAMLYAPSRLLGTPGYMTRTQLPGDG